MKDDDELIISFMPPLNLGRDFGDYCAYDWNGNSFETAIAEVGESDFASGTSYESWAEIPTSRTRLLKLCQKPINDGNAKEIVFVSGDQHWAEIQAKKMTFDENAGDEQILYEVTASGIDQRWNFDVDNPNRVRVRSADSQGSGDFVYECNFPFEYKGVVYNDCDTVGHDRPWCSTKTDSNNKLLWFNRQNLAYVVSSLFAFQLSFMDKSSPLKLGSFPSTLRQLFYFDI